MSVSQFVCVSAAWIRRQFVQLGLPLAWMACETPHNTGASTGALYNQSIITVFASRFQFSYQLDLEIAF